ncbi:MAG TPA: glycosyltransferase family 4 protein [Candidatus Acidoferrum sp.]|jgi:glycosyltransferase involved in cell wall biosynthesis|nr:glycosyltransferase family 4 protein [Candidatus Acidoferrum sp.]
MKVLLVHSAYQQYGGEDSVVKAETELLQSHGDEVILYGRHNDEIKDFNIFQKAAFVPQSIYSWKTSSELDDVVRRVQPDVAFIHNIYPLISPSVYHALHALGVPAVQVLHNFRPFCPNGLFYTQNHVCEACKSGNYLNAVKNRCFRGSAALSGLYGLVLGLNRMARMVDKISGFICLTEFFRIKMREVGIPESKLFVRPNFVRAPALRETRDSSGYALFLGRLSPEKGCWMLIRAFEQLPGVHLKIVGTGPMEQELREYIRNKGIQNIEMLGFKAGEEKWEILRNALCVVLPSEWYENFPVTALEGFMAARPVVASRIGGLPYIVEDGKSGLLFEPGNAEELAQHLRYLVGHPAEAESMGRRGRMLTETKYGPEEGYENLMRVFAQVRGKQAAAVAAI